MTALVEVEDLVMHYPAGEKGVRGQKAVVHALDGVSLRVEEGETFALVGESGSGKSTLGRCILALETPTAGTVRVAGVDVNQISPRELVKLRREMQVVFQDPYGSLNPRKRVEQIIGDVLRVHSYGDRAAVSARVSELLEQVGLSPEQRDRYPHELSGGQRQRVGIARAIALQPKLVIADEPVSALDVSIQAQILNLLSDLQAEFGLTYVMIAHDLGVVRHVANHIAVLYLGKLAEVAERDQLFDRPFHPYTQALLSSVPIPDPVLAESRERIMLPGDPPSPTNPPPGCRFHTRCPFATERCSTEEPAMLTYPDGRTVACHHPQNATAEEISAAALQPTPTLTTEIS